ncbi:MAG: hypothetical protein GY950_18835 [bacterium]|nr:hypothetical protein [bacterium]
MKIDYTPEALTQIELIGEMATIENGFLTGTVMGKHIIVEQLFPVNFNETNIETIYGKMYRKTGEQLLGVFFNNREPFFCDWFLEDVILKIDPSQPEPESFQYQFENGPRNTRNTRKI